jgi:hypothetical protein
MKIRNGFVSNSSTSSFLCNICNRLETEYEMACDANMYKCVHGHTFCFEHTLNRSECDKDYRESGEVSKKNCPLCQMEEMEDKHIVEYFMKNLELSKKDLIKMISTQFESYKEFIKYLKD